jgi:protoporphyrinogen oxidase
MLPEHFHYCIVGAGPSGLTAAYRLLKAGQKVLLIDRDPRIGGLAKSYDYDGHIFDTGPKRFHTDDQVVLDFIQEIARDQIERIGRSTKVYFTGKYFEWPLQSTDLFKMPAGIAGRCFIELLQKRPIKDHTSFHQYIYAKYGETLYQTFFEPYTKKFLRWDVEDIHSDWASTGINRTVIDKRIKSNTMFDLFKSLLLPQKIETEFLYPSVGGFGGFYEILSTACRAFPNFHLLLNDSIVGLEEQGTKFSALTKSLASLSFDQLIWTGNLNDLSRIIRADNKSHYLNTIFYNVVCKESGVGARKAQWIYISQGNSLISRITCMKEFSSYTCPSGYYNFICEVTDSQQQPLYFIEPTKYLAPLMDELLTMSFLKNLKAVEDVKINPVVDTYPIYHRDYHQAFATAARAVKQFSPRIHLLGRSGAFWYNNSDHSIRFAIELTKKLLGQQAEEFNYRDYFGGVHSRANTSRDVAL